MLRRLHISCMQGKSSQKRKVTEALQMRGYSDLEAKEMTNMTGRRRGPPPFEAMKMRTEEEHAARGSSDA